MLGDSLTWSMVQSLWALIDLQSKLPRYQGSETASISCSHGEVKLIIHDPTNQMNDAALILIARSVATPRSLTILNFGAHYSGAKSSSILEFAEDVRRLASTLTSIHSDSLVVYRTMQVAHPGCELQSVPWSPETVVKEIEESWERCRRPNGPLSCPITDKSTKKYDWDEYATFDHLASSALSLTNVRRLNVTTMSALRPDAHSKVRYGGGRLPPDCSHWSLPGVPDWWNVMLLWALAECE